ncbi:MAG: hypothetical protein AAGD18_23640 [Actinomycetota bacterium]
MIALGVGLAIGALVAGVMGPLLAGSGFQRTNFRGEPIATAAGLVVVVTVVLVEAVVTVASSLSPDLDARLSLSARLATLLVVVGFGLVGLLDDLAGDRATKGFRGHVLALARGRPSTGSWKLVVGGAVALVAVGLDAEIVDEPLRLLLAAGLVALGANLGNLFDLAPGRATKVATLAVVPLVVVAGGAELIAPLDPDVLAVSWGPLVVLGAAWALLPGELGERLMLGDTGANVLGAAAGLFAVLVLGLGGQLVVGAILVLLNLASERVSFSRVIGAVPPLRWVDELGRRPPP